MRRDTHSQGQWKRRDGVVSARENMGQTNPMEGRRRGQAFPHPIMGRGKGGWDKRHGRSGHENFLSR
jgi:hypothetical protein